ncbi:MAG TPA: hypothetical protein VGF81_02145 [Solirubrobacteraceae bacterium]|jgi:hypothetical protein
MNEQLIQQLVATRAAIGSGAWLMPRFSGRLFGLDPDANPQAPYLARLFGVRDVVLGVGLNSSSGAERQQWLRLGVACDLADAAAGVLAGRSGALPKRATLLVTATALAAAAMGIAAMRGEETETAPPS